VRLVVKAFWKPVHVYRDDKYRVVSGTWAKKAVKFGLVRRAPSAGVRAPGSGAEHRTLPAAGPLSAHRTFRTV